MTPNHDHATLFVAPAASPADKAGGGSPDASQPTADGSADAMHRLRHPFAVGPSGQVELVARGGRPPRARDVSSEERS